MHILVIGSGGREHAFAWKLSRSLLCTRLSIAPGNAGTAECGTNVPLAVTDQEGLLRFCVEQDVSLVVVGPEVPLVEGLADAFQREETRHIRVIGPVAAGAMLEGSKAFAKQFMVKYSIPTAAYLEVTLDTLEKGISFLDDRLGPYVLKADGLAAGKGVLIVEDRNEAKIELRNMLSGKFGQASKTVVIEEFLHGMECSAFVLTDGRDFLFLPEAKDYKRVGEQDTGLNTGGMGAVSPVPFFTPDLRQKVIDQIVRPTIAGLSSENIPYVGFLFFGLMIVGDEPFVIEYNCRMGDPETEVVIPRIENDLAEVLLAAAEGRLSGVTLHITPQSVATVMLVSGGYPGDFVKGMEIGGLTATEGSLLFHAGTALRDGRLVTEGGRVLAVTSFDDDFYQAVSKSVENAERIHFDGKYYRKDIGFDLG